MRLKQDHTRARLLRPLATVLIAAAACAPVAFAEDAKPADGAAPAEATVKADANFPNADQAKNYFAEGVQQYRTGRYKDADPFITADGKHLFFISDRPVPGKAHRDLDIWTADRVGAHWSEPRNLGSPVNSEGQEWYPTVAADGTLYFGSDRPGGKGKTDIYRARFVDGKYAAPENLGDTINTAGDEYEPFLAPDGRTLFFMADNREGRGDSDIFVSWLCDGVWTKSEPLGGGVNSPGNEYAPKISPDGRYFFWSSTRSTMRRLADKTFDTQAYLAAIRGPGNGLGDIYQIDLDALNLQPKCGKTEKN